MSANPPTPSTPAASYVPPANTGANRPQAPAPEPAGISERDAASQIEDLFRKKREGTSDRGEDGKFKPKNTPAEAQEGPKAAPEADGEGDVATEAPEGPEDDDLGPAAGEAVEAAGEDGEDFEETDFTHKGKTYKIPKPLVDGAMRQADYSQKMEVVANREKQVLAQAHLLETRQAIISELAPALAQVENTRQQIEQLRGSMPDPDHDPIGYIKFDKHIRDLEVGLNQLQQAVANRGTELATQEQSARAELMRKGYAVVAKAIPKWSDAAYRKQVGEFAVSQGYTQEELTNLTDPRLIALMNDAMLYRKVREARAHVQKKLDTAPPIVRPGSTTNQAGTDKARAQEAISRVKRTGKTDDATNALLAILRGAKRR
jgi:hypothetical protein